MFAQGKMTILRLTMLECTTLYAFLISLVMCRHKKKNKKLPLNGIHSGRAVIGTFWLKFWLCSLKWFDCWEGTTGIEGAN